MSEMVERVRTALAALAGNVSGCGSDKCCCYGLEAFECKTGLDVDVLARAAIEAMREPTKEMMAAGTHPPLSELYPFQHQELVWKGMIDAALK